MKSIRLLLAAALLAASPGGRAWAGWASLFRRQPASQGTLPVAASGGVENPARLAFPPAVDLPLLLAAPAAVPSLAEQTQTPSASPAPFSSSSATRTFEPPSAQSVRRHAASLGKAAMQPIQTARDEASFPEALSKAGEDLGLILTGQVSEAPQEAVEGLSHETEDGFCAHGCPHGHEFRSERRSRGGLPPPELGPRQKNRFKSYAYAVAAVKVGIESMNLAIPTLLLARDEPATMVGALYIAGDMAGLLGGVLAGPIVDRFKPLWILPVSALVQALMIGALAFHWGSPVSLFALFSLNSVFSGVFDVARRAAMPYLVGSDEGTLREYNGRLYLPREVAAIGGALAAGALAEALGYLPALCLHPAAYLLAAFFFLRSALRHPEATRSMAGQAHSGLAPKMLSGMLRDMLRGAGLVLKTPLLRLGLLVNIPVLVVHELFHALLSVSYATLVLGKPALAAVIMAAWNMGELTGAWYMKRHGRRTPTHWGLYYAAGVGLSAWLLWAVPSVWIAGPVVFLLGSATLGNELALTSFFQAAAPKNQLGSVTAFIYPLGTVVAMISLLAMSWAFDRLSPQEGFRLFAIFLSAFSALNLYAAKRFCQPR